MTSVIITVACTGPGLTLPGDPPVRTFYNPGNACSPCEAYQHLLHRSHEDVLIYFHDDVTVYDEDWREFLMAQFQNPKCVAVGLGGGTSLGNQDLYRRPYQMNNMARRGYASNQTDAEVHGQRLRSSRRVAVLDAFCMAVRRDFLLSVGGWPVDRLTHHCLDLWLACEAARRGKEIWMIGASCTHHGGGTSTNKVYTKARWLQGGSLAGDHRDPHHWLWNEYRDVLPIEVD